MIGFQIANVASRVKSRPMVIYCSKHNHYVRRVFRVSSRQSLTKDHHVIQNLTYALFGQSKRGSCILINKKVLASHPIKVVCLLLASTQGAPA